MNEDLVKVLESLRELKREMIVMNESMDSLITEVSHLV